MGPARPFSCARGVLMELGDDIRDVSLPRSRSNGNAAASHVDGPASVPRVELCLDRLAATVIVIGSRAPCSYSCRSPSRWRRAPPAPPVVAGGRASRRRRGHACNPGSWLILRSASDSLGSFSLPAIRPLCARSHQALACTTIHMRQLMVKTQRQTCSSTSPAAP